jgi:hypothetical protein
MVVDPDDRVEVARAVGWACRRAGRFVVHTSPGQRRAWRFQDEVLGALGKHWDRAAQGGDATCAQLTQAWLRAELARELIVLRAHQITGPALHWLLALPAQEGLQVWMVSLRPLPAVAEVDGVAVTSTTPAELDQVGGWHDRLGCGCEDLNILAPRIPPVASATVGLSVDIARRLRRLPPAGLRTRSRNTPTRCCAAGLVGCLLPEEWACDVAATYLTLRLEEAERHSGVQLIDPALPLLPPVAWHERRDPGAEQLAWLTRSRWLCRPNP